MVDAEPESLASFCHGANNRLGYLVPEARGQLEIRFSSRVISRALREIEPTLRCSWKNNRGEGWTQLIKFLK